MKKLLVVLMSLAIVAAPGLQARQYNEGPRNDISASYGFITISQFALAFGGVLGAAFSGGQATPDDILSTGSLQLEYLHRSNNWLWMGFNVSGEKDTLVITTKDSDGNVTGKSNSDLITGNLCLTAKANWLRRKRMAMYSRLSGGVFTTFGEETNLAPSLQISPIGIEAGGQNFRGFIEIGVGMHGVLSGGFKYLF